MKKPMVDYRQFRFSKLNTPEFSHLKLLGGWIVYFILYFLTENLIPPERCHLVHSALDDLIPFHEGFAIPYCLWFLLIAVTLLTSTDQVTLRDELLIDKPMADVVRQYALNAKAAGLDGVVCSAFEAADIHAACGDDFITVTPGIRFEDSAADDQKRVMTPARAREAGSDYIVVGRPITAAERPIDAYVRCKEEFLQG